MANRAHKELLNPQSITDVKAVAEQLDLYAEDYSRDVVEKFLIKLHSGAKLTSLAAESILSQLISSDLKEIDLSWIIELYPEQPEYAFAIKALRIISSKAKIAKLKIKFPMSALVPQINEALRNAIRGIASLQHIDIDRFHFTLDELMNLCRGFSSLTEVHVKIAAQSLQRFEDPNLPEALKECFGKLSAFCFSSLSKEDFSKEFEEKLTRLCVQHLPNLRRVGNLNNFVDMTKACTKQREVSKLCHLSLLLKRNVALAFANLEKFPDVNFLTIKWDSDFKYPPLKESNFDALLKFSKLNTLKLKNLTSPLYFKQILIAYNKQLKELSMRHDSTIDAIDLELKIIQGFCPALEIIDMRGMRHIVDDDSGWSMASFSALTELNLIFKEKTNHIRLSDVLSAPNLQEVTLINILVSEDELQKTSDLAEAKSILSKINRLEMVVFKEDNVDDSLENAITTEWGRLERVLQEFRPNAAIDLSRG